MATYTQHQTGRVSRFQKILLLSVGLAAVALAIYVWALFNAIYNILSVTGLLSVLALFLCPLLLAFVSIRSTLRQLKIATNVPPILDHTMLSLRQCALLITIDALVFIPILAIFALYMDLFFATILSNPSLPTTYNQKAVEALALGFGLWGANFFAAALGVIVAIRLRHLITASVVAVVVLLFTMCVNFMLVDSTNSILAVIPALIPYVLTGTVFLMLRAPKSEIVLDR